MYTKRVLSINTLLAILGPSIIFLVIYSSAIYFLYEFTGYDDIAIPLSVPTVLGTAISILLGFRTSSAYDRWWEGRKIWGAIINDSRTLVRQSIGFIVGKEKSDHIKMIAHRQIAWCYSLNHSLRNLSVPEEVNKYLGTKEYDSISSQTNMPNGILKFHEEYLSSIYQNQNIESYHFTAMDQTLKGLCDHMGKCERIKKTVFPLQYSIIARWAIFLFLLILPFGMVSVVGPFVVPITIIVAFFFLLIEKIAFYLQDPFENREADVPLSSICRTIEINLLEMIDEKDIPETLLPNERGILM